MVMVGCDGDDGGGDGGGCGDRWWWYGDSDDIGVGGSDGDDDFHCFTLRGEKGIRVRGRFPARPRFFFCKGQRVSILKLCAQYALHHSYSTLLLSCQSSDWFPIKRYLQKQTTSHIWSVGYRLPTCTK